MPKSTPCCSKRHACDGVGRTATRFIHFERPAYPSPFVHVGATSRWPRPKPGDSTYVVHPSDRYARCPVCARIVTVSTRGKVWHHMAPPPEVTHGVARTYADLIAWGLTQWRVTRGGYGLALYDARWRLLQRAAAPRPRLAEAESVAYTAALVAKYGARQG